MFKCTLTKAIYDFGDSHSFSYHAGLLLEIKRYGTYTILNTWSKGNIQMKYLKPVKHYKTVCTVVFQLHTIYLTKRIDKMLDAAEVRY